MLQNECLSKSRQEKTCLKIMNTYGKALPKEPGVFELKLEFD